MVKEFDPNKPQDTDFLSVSQLDLQSNFFQMNSIFNDNHYKFNFIEDSKPYDFADSTDRGKHRNVVFKELSSDPSTAAGEIAQYAKSINSNVEWFTRLENDGQIVQMTGPFIQSANGETVIPGGIHLKWGTINLDSSSKTVNFSSLSLNNFPNNAYQAIATYAVSTNTNFNVAVTSISTTSITLARNTSINTNVQFIAVGN